MTALATVSIPYGQGKIEAHIPKSNLQAVVELRDLEALSHPENAIRAAIDNPINCDKISQMAGKGDKIAIAVPDIFHKGAYSALTLAIILSELHSLGVRREDITIIDAIGVHRPNTPEEFEAIVGREICEKYRVVNHDGRDKNNLVDLGRSKLGDPVIMNRLVAESDLFIGIADLTPVPTAGYSGGSKMIGVGCASLETISYTHSLSIYWHPKSRCGVYVDNPFRDHLDAITRRAESESKSGKLFFVNVVVNGKGEVIGANAGDVIDSYLKGCTLADRQWKFPLREAADMVIAGAGYPHDGSPYNISLSTSMLVLYPKPVFRQGGVVIFSAPCDEPIKEGSSDLAFITAMRNAFSIEDIYNLMKEYEKKGELTPFGIQRAYGTALVVSRAREVLVVGPKVPGVVRDMLHTPVKTMDEALKRAFEELGSSAKVLVAPTVRLGGCPVIDIQKD